MIICGIELKSSEAIIALITYDENHVQYNNIDTKKIKLTDGDCQNSVSSFFKTFSSFFRDNGVELVAIKKRAKTGKFGGGADSFKMEGLIQLCEVEVKLIPPQTINSVIKKKQFAIPVILNKYQNEAYLVACCAGSKASD